MIKKWGILILISSLGVLTACSTTEAEQPQPKEESIQKAEENNMEAYHKITAEEAKEKIDKGNITIVDVRTEEEYAEKHIENAILIPNETIGTEQPELLPDKTAVLLVYCRSGVRSKDASQKLVELGYEHVYDMGGIQNWPYETVAEEEEQ